MNVPRFDSLYSRVGQITINQSSCINCIVIYIYNYIYIYIYLMAKTPTLWSSNMAMKNPAFNLILVHAFPSHSKLHFVQAFPSHVWWHRWVPVGCLQTSLAWRKKALSSWYNWTSMVLWAPSTCAGATRTHQPWRNRNWIWIGFCWDVFNDQDDQVVLGLQGIWDHYYIQFLNIPKLQINQCWNMLQLLSLRKHR